MGRVGMPDSFLVAAVVTPTWSGLLWRLLRWGPGFLVCLLGPLLLIRTVRHHPDRRVRRGVYFGLALLVALTVALDCRMILYWTEVNRTLAGTPPESIRITPESDRLVRDAVHPQFVKRSVVWVDEWSGSGLTVEYDSRTGRLVGAHPSSTADWSSRVAWRLNAAALATLFGALLGAGAWLQERSKRPKAA